MQPPPIILIVLSILSILVLVFKDRIKKQNSDLTTIPEPLSTIILVLMLFAVTIILTNLAVPNYIPIEVLAVARAINMVILAFVAYRAYTNRKNSKSS